MERGDTTLLSYTLKYISLTDVDILFQVGLQIFHYETQIKREVQGIHICGCRCNERLRTKTDGSSHLTYTGSLGELEHLKIETRLIGETFEYVMGECVI